MRRGGIKFQVLADEILTYSSNHHRDTRNVKSRIRQILPEFAEREAASILPSDIDNWIVANRRRQEPPIATGRCSH